jgi:hypothetical protein
MTVGMRISKLCLLTVWATSIQVIVAPSNDLTQSTANGGDFTVKAITDTRVVISYRGSLMVSKDALRFGPGFTTQVQKDAAIAQLEALGIESTVTI